MDIPVVLLSGGKSSRFGADKSKVDYHGRPLIEQVISTFPVETEFIIVGPKFNLSESSFTFTREVPAGGGPVAALAAGVALVNAKYAAVIATDLPFAGKVIQELVQHLSPTQDALIPLDSSGRLQSLCAIYRVDSLRDALISLGSLDGKSMRALISLLQIKEIDLGEDFASSLLDIDAPADLQAALRLAVSRENEE